MGLELQVPISQRAVRVGTAGAEKRKEIKPVAPLIEIEVRNQDRGPVARRPDKDASVWLSCFTRLRGCL